MTMDTTLIYPRFELVSDFADQPELLPVRSTKFSAGYDFVVAQDTIVPAAGNQMDLINSYIHSEKISGRMEYNQPSLFTLDEVAKITKSAKAKVTLVPTGVKAYMPEGMFLQISVRSSCPLKHWLILGNGVGIIDADYYNNPDNEGHIFFQIINLFPHDILLHKGDKIGQGIFLPYFTTYGDNVETEREGGFGSTSK